jgi:hypothetical protein
MATHIEVRRNALLLLNLSATGGFPGFWDCFPPKNIIVDLVQSGLSN